MSRGKPVRLWDLSGLIYREATLQSLMTAAGGNPGPLRERLGRNPGYVRRQSIAVQLIAAVYVLTVMALPVTAVLRLRAGTTQAWNLLISSASAATFFVIQLGYVLTMTVLAVSELLDEDLYAWPRTLPLSAGGVGRLRLLSLLRGLFIPVCGVAAAYPIAMAAASRSWAVAAVALLTSAVHLPLTLALVVLAGRRLHRGLKGHGGTSRSAQTARVITTLGYGLGTILVILVMQVAMNSLARFYDTPRLATAASRGLVLALSCAPLPTAPAALTMLLAARAAGLAVELPVLPALLGTLAYFSVSATLVGAALRVLGRTGAGAAAAARTADGSGPAPVRLRVTSPSRAFLRQFWLGATRETQALMFLLFPLIFPILGTIGPTISRAPAAAVLYMGAAMAAILSPWMLVQGLTRQEAGAGQLAASLPVRERDRVFPRLVLAPMVAFAGALLEALLFLRGTNLVTGLALGLMPAVTAPTGLLLKMVLFGRMKHRVVLDEVYPESTTLKWVAVIATMAVTAGALAVLQYILVLRTSLLAGSALFVAVLAALVGGLCALSRRLFP
jgi:hypothetical protein